MNLISEFNDLRIYSEPLVGVASTDDPFFPKLKDPQVIAPFHMNPVEWLPQGKSVLSYFLPFTPEIRKANRKGELPATEWLHGRIAGEQLNDGLREHLCQWFRVAGYEAIAPALDDRYFVRDRKSNWSERHVAYIAGLGTFCLSKGVITAKGSAGRFGSVIVSCYIEKTPRPYTDLYEYCIQCGACIKRCPPKAINLTEKDHGPCSEFIEEMKVRFKPRYGCGKCQTAVPCEQRIPKTPK